MLPNLIVIGGARCGTTSLHAYLDLHPEIFMSKRKELDFFAVERNWQRGLAWYESHFRRPTKVRGESSPCYSRHPVNGGVPERMASIVPDAKLIYLVRDPMVRTVSDYRFSRWIVGRPVPEPGQSLADFDRSPYVVSSRYAMQLERYLEHYPLEQILVVDTADLAASRKETLRRVFRFLGVDESFESPRFVIQHNALREERLTKAGRRTANLLDRIIGEHRTWQLRARTPRALQRPFTRHAGVAPVELDEGLRSRLAECLKEEADRLRRLTGEAFESWSV